MRIGDSSRKVLVVRQPIVPHYNERRILVGSIQDGTRREPDDKCEKVLINQIVARIIIPGISPIHIGEPSPTSKFFRTYCPSHPSLFALAALRAHYPSHPPLFAHTALHTHRPSLSPPFALTTLPKGSVASRVRTRPNSGRPTPAMPASAVGEQARTDRRHTPTGPHGTFDRLEEGGHLCHQLGGRRGSHGIRT